jgi:hypothetical protein
VFAFAIHEQGCEEDEFRALLVGRQAFCDLLGGLAFDAIAANMTMLLARSSPEHAEVVGDLGDRTDRRARVIARRLLLDRDRRRETADRVVARLLHLSEELARVGGEAFDVAALALGIERVEGKRRLPGSGDARHHDELLLRDIDIDGFEVVLAGASNLDVVELLGDVAAEFLGTRLLRGGGSHSVCRVGNRVE